MNKFVVTGAGGMIGRALVERLLRSGKDVLPVSRHPIRLGCDSLEADLTEPGVLSPFLNSRTTVFHLAGATSVSGSVRNPRDDFAVNAGGLLNVLESVREKNARMVFASSASVFDPRSPLPHAETAPKSPSSPYAAAKLAGEGYCAAYHKCYGTDVKIARLFNVYGPGMTRFAIYDFYRKIRVADGEIEILGDGQQVRDYLYIDDAVEGLLLIARGGDPGEDYNLATGEPTTSLELAQFMLELMGRRKVRIRTSGQTFPGDVPAWYADISKLASLGFEPAISLREGLSRTIEQLTPHGSRRLTIEGVR